MAWAVVCPSVCPSVRHTAVLYQNGASKNHEIFTVGCPKNSSSSWRNFLLSNEGVRWVPPLLPLKDVILTLLALLVWKRLQIGTYMLLIITSTGHELFSFINTDDFKLPKIRGFREFFVILVCNRVAEWIAPEWLERLRQPACEIFSIKRKF